MLKIEKKLIDLILRYKYVLFFLAITVIGLLVRYTGRNFISGDMRKAFLPWYDEISAAGGFGALKSQVGDYSILYQIFIAIFTYIPIKALYLYKMMSIIFDYILAFSSALLVCHITNKKVFSPMFVAVYSSIIMLPTVFLNSGYWGQCDSIYTTFIVLLVYFLLKDKPCPAFIMLGIAMAIKFQTVFILPFVITYYICKRSFSCLYGFLSIFVFWAIGIPAYISGRSILSPFTIYFEQTEIFHKMYLGFNSFWVIIGNNYKYMGKMALIFTMAILGAELMLVLTKKKKFDDNESVINTAIWMIWTALLFLPAMHDRYAFMLDILLIVISFLDKKYAKFALVSCLISFTTYGCYLFDTPLKVNAFTATIYILAWVYYSATVMGYKPKLINEQIAK